MPLISIIVPVYNVESYLEKCINSIINQSYKNLEIILVNDGSKDRSGEICDFYASKDDRIKIINKSNGGLSDARNCGLEVAKGEYIAFIDSDDWVDKDLYKILYELIIKYNSDISVCSFKKAVSEGENLNNINDEVVYTNITALEKIYADDGVDMVVAWNKLFKKDILIGEKFPKGKIHEDVFLIPRLMYKAKSIAYTNKELIYYRVNPNSITNSEFNIKRLDYIEALESTSRFYKDNNLDELYIKSVTAHIEAILSMSIDVKKSLKFGKDEIFTRFIEKINENELIIKKYMNKKTKLKIKLFKNSPNLFVNLFLLKDKFKTV